MLFAALSNGRKPSQRGPAYRGWLDAAESLLTVVFFLEFASRFVATRHPVPHLRRHWIDLLALVPVARGLRVMRLIRLVRFLRVFAGLNRALDYRGLETLVVAWLAVMLIASAGLYIVEGEVNPNLTPLDALWWAIATLTRGDAGVTAVTWEGKMATGLLLIFGVAMFTAITGTLVAYFIESRNRGRSLDSRDVPVGRL